MRAFIDEKVDRALTIIRGGEDVIKGAGYFRIFGDDDEKIIMKVGDADIHRSDIEDT